MTARLHGDPQQNKLKREAMRDGREQAGICISCGDEPAERGRQSCRPCLNYRTLRGRGHRVVLNGKTCGLCGSNEHTRPRCPKRLT